jgi:hypothetical protein
MISYLYTFDYDDETLNTQDAREANGEAGVWLALFSGVCVYDMPFPTSTIFRGLKNLPRNDSALGQR